MLFVYFKIAWRNLLKQRQFTILNLLGLSTGLACALLIYLWVQDELNIDTFNKKDTQLYQVIKTAHNGDGSIETFETTPALLAQAMAKEIPEVEYAVPVVVMDDYGENKGIITAGNKNVKACAQFAGKDYFQVFSYRLLQGNKDKVLADRYGVILSDKLARKLFNTTDNIVGKTITWDQGDKLNGQYMVTGVFEAPPARYFAGLAIIISCLGLFGLAAFTAQKRQKEIGVRKVVGATVQQIVMLLSKDFLKLVLLAVVIAFPLAWWVLNQWLHNFAYRINIGVGLFLLSAAAILLITIITISFQSIKAAIANPVKSLRSE